MVFGEDFMFAGDAQHTCVHDDASYRADAAIKGLDREMTAGDVAAESACSACREAPCTHGYAYSGIRNMGSK